MIVKLKMKTDLVNQTRYPVVTVPQNDGDCRIMEIALYAGEETWQIPEGVNVRLYYARADGTGGSYDSLEDGSLAWKADGNILTVMLIPQIFTVAGNVAAKVEFRKEDKWLNTFDFWIQVMHGCSDGAVKVEDYFNWAAWTNQELEMMLKRAKESGAFAGPQGIQGIQGPAGAAGYTPVKGVDYFTDTDKAEWEGYIVSELAKRGQLKPEFAETIEQCTDTTKLYVLPDGFIYAYVSDGGTTVETVTEQIIGTTDNPWSAGRLSSGNPNGISGYVTTPYIDLQKYSVPFVLHLKGITFSYKNYGAATQSYLRWSQYKTDKTHLITDMTQASAFGPDYWNNAATLTDVGDGSVEIAFTPPVTNKSGVEIGYARFSGYGTEANANVYITYEREIHASGWENTGHAFVPADYETRIVALEQKIEDFSVDEDVNIAVFTVANPAVKAFMASADYADGDYSYSNVTNYSGNEYYRKDLPFPVVLGWKKETAVQYVVTVGSQTYYTQDNHLSVWNLVPNKTYSFTIFALCANGSITAIKNGSFTTAADKTRMLNIDGIQNVRDIGGYSGMNGKKVKYGLIYRGSGMDEAIQSNLRITGMGKQEMVARVGIKTDLDLRGANNITESALGSGVDFYTPPYSYLHYASAITDATSKGYFKIMLEYIVTQLTNSKPVYIHCSGGCDRTGTLVFLLLGLLGVSESDLAKEYELSSFSAIGAGRCRNSSAYDYKGMVNAIKAYNGSTTTDKFVAFATECGVSSATITSFRNLMLG